jgi:hypothetical protein
LSIACTTTETKPFSPKKVRVGFVIGAEKQRQKHRRKGMEIKNQTEKRGKAIKKLKHTEGES